MCDRGGVVTRTRAQGGSGGERRAGRSKRPSGSSGSGSLGRGALSDPDIQSRLQPNLSAYWVRIFTFLIDAFVICDNPTIYSHTTYKTVGENRIRAICLCFQLFRRLKT